MRIQSMYMKLLRQNHGCITAERLYLIWLKWLKMILNLLSENPSSQSPRMGGRSPRKLQIYKGNFFKEISFIVWYFSLTVHFVSETFERKDFVLGAFDMGNVRHTGENIAKNITQCIKNNGLLKEKLFVALGTMRGIWKMPQKGLNLRGFFKFFSYY